MEDFVNFKLAQKLKEKGFKEECLCHYVGEDSLLGCLRVMAFLKQKENKI